MPVTIHNLSDARAPRLKECALDRRLLSSGDVLIQKKTNSGIRVLEFLLPEPLRALGSQAGSCHLVELGEESKLLIHDEQSVYLQADWHIEQADTRLRLWLQIDHFETATLLEAAATRVRNWSHSSLACCVNAIPQSTDKYRDTLALFCMTQIEFNNALEIPRIVAVDDITAVSPGFEKIFSGECPETIDALIKQTEKSEHAALNLRSRANTTYIAAETFLQARNYSAARDHFHEAQRAGHPLAFERELEVQALLAKPLHGEYPEVFDWIRRGERGRALFTLRDMARKYPEEGNAILSYALRNFAQAEEGLRAAEESLSINPRQTDVHANRWAFLVESDQKTKLIEASSSHLRHYPQDPVAQRNLVDSLIAGEEFESAIVAAHFHLIFAQNSQNAIQTVFSAYEAIEEWDLLAALLDRIMNSLRGPTAKTLCLYGECLTEVARFDESFSSFEQAMCLEPGNANVALGFARALARADEEHMAIDLLSSVLADPNRIDKKHERALLISLLGEILRRTGNWEQALLRFESEFGESLHESVDFAGPMPALEYSESLLLAGRTTEARELLTYVQRKFPGDQFVDELAWIAANSC